MFPNAESGVGTRCPLGELARSGQDVLRFAWDARDVDLWEFYERVEKLILDLRVSGHHIESDEVETAIRGGATSGEVLGRLSVALPAVANRLPEGFRSEVEILAVRVSGVLGRQ